MQVLFSFSFDFLFCPTLCSILLGAHIDLAVKLRGMRPRWLAEVTNAEQLKKANSDTTAAKSDTSRLEQKYGQLYDQYAAALGRIEQVATEKGAIERLLKRYQARELEVAVLQEENTELKSAVSQLRQICEEMLKEMERQQLVYQRASQKCGQYLSLAPINQLPRLIWTTFRNYLRGQKNSGKIIRPDKSV